MIRITFFHDVICPFCYVTSKRLRNVVKEFKGEVVVKHKAFSIISSLEDLKEIAPTIEDARKVFLNEFQILKKYFQDYEPEKVVGKGKIGYVWSIPPLMACKAAEFQKGDEGHWTFFDRAQDKFFLEGEDITRDEVLIEVAKEVGLDVEQFKKDFKSKKAKLAVIEDEEEAKAMGIRGVPAILINDTWLIRGVQPEDFLKKAIEDVLEHGEPKTVNLKAFWERE
ncbi:MAG: DsbA family protein [Sulfolobus sp.]|nr:DsbA family protein [Sulfolobus sp.]